MRHQRRAVHRSFSTKNNVTHTKEILRESPHNLLRNKRRVLRNSKASRPNFSN